MTAATIEKAPSPASLRYLTDLVRDRQVEPGENATESLAKLAHWLAKPRSQKQVSAMIDRVKGKPARPAYAPVAVTPAHTAYVPYPSVPDAVPNSKFAVLTELLTEAPESWRRQEYLFFEVKELRKRRVVRRLLGAPGSFSRTGLPPALASELFGLLESQEFAYTAALTFGTIYRVCGRCAAELTDDTSRERKFGPVCWDLMAAHRAAAGL